VSRISSLFAEKKPFIAYLTTGDNDTLTAARALIAGGADMLEIGVPFTDPSGDGPVIRKAMERALASGTTLSDAFGLARTLRDETEIPLILFSYYNPILAAGPALYPEAKKAGFNAILIVDLPIEEAKEHIAACKENALDPIFLISPSTTEERLKTISANSSGFLYYVCQKGATGMRNALPEDLPAKIATLKSHTKLPIAVGFGVSTPDMVTQILACADAVIVGSYFVKALEEGRPPQELQNLCQSLISQ
jgi:tryptophan synthase alpha chain